MMRAYSIAMNERSGVTWHYDNAGMSGGQYRIKLNEDTIEIQDMVNPENVLRIAPCDLERIVEDMDKAEELM